PYIGVVFEIHIFQYFAPLSSKDFRNKKSNDTFHLISESENLGVIHINNMIPVINLNMISEIDINNIKNISYKNLLDNQARILRNETFTNILITKAESLYQSVTKESNINRQDRFYKKLSNDFKNLEEYILKIDISVPTL
ncbi:type III toxin-antitoxin system ToxN/AbiQ family toxin, partial [Taylorella equigenitalis]|uniref:type III toxin-antitoxin system ToxN/AbiQ family toxin n=1 Tax=Taylorella equigenitalis TaxID=29575 RepID=UPI0039EE769F